ncbi:MAG: hypothetical protein RsTaC01_1023 [Candidatus Paraimprobicoccus trichonymphae]|uniref:Uncharacterized protein n=1 Tax=Candidatus Paraimprobicoccus trichonymphae TaxID=3033793 RepID=A0AA48I530_9FIRM|nr:MAG: hypothetical protein RsTaC01_1023 [Candidatus Paraimprobicoccus trichonymphae]
MTERIIIENIFEKIQNNEILSQKFVKNETIEEMYNFCIEIQDGYSIEEFTDFITEMCEYASFDDISENQLSNVTGGKTLFSDKTNKFVSTILTSMALSSPLAAINKDSLNKKTDSISTYSENISSINPGSVLSGYEFYKNLKQN